MPGSTDKHFEKSPCSVRNEAVPVIVTCEACGAEVERWSDETEAACPCGARLPDRKQ